MDEELREARTLIKTVHDSLPDDWTPYEGTHQLLQALTGQVGDDQQKIAEMGLQVVCMLLAKNRRYGNSALDPLRVFARDLSPRDQMHVRMDDKLSRLVRGTDHTDGEDPIFDLVGYAILDLIAAHDEEVATDG